MPLPFWKYEAIGNDFPLVTLDAAPDLGALAVRMADRRFGVGGDGLLAVGAEEGDLRLRMFNPDGTEDFCGNGLRIAARHAADVLAFPTGFTIRHRERRVPTRVDGPSIATTLGVASYAPADVPHLGEEAFDAEIVPGFRGSALTTGSTHVVLRLADLPSDDVFLPVSRALENDPRFPDRTSVIWTAPDGDGLRVRIWERGVGETQGCGTGSSAAAADEMRRRGRGGEIAVRNPGGTIRIAASAWDAPLTVVGEARRVFSGTWRGGL